MYVCVYILGGSNMEFSEDYPFSYSSEKLMRSLEKTNFNVFDSECKSPGKSTVTESNSHFSARGI
jgi:hypothetical protein